MRSNSCDCPFSVFRKYAKIGIVNDSKKGQQSSKSKEK